MRIRIYTIALLLLAWASFAETGGLLPLQIETVAKLEGTNQIYHLQLLLDTYTAQLSATNASTVFHFGSRLRPPLLFLARGPDTNLESRSKAWLECIAHPSDLDLFDWNKALLKRPAREIADTSLEWTITMAMAHIVAEAGDALSDPVLKTQDVDADSSAAIASFETSAKINGHARSYVMYFRRSGERWKLEYYNLVWLE